jgi:NADPH:quinone reductase
MINKGVVLAKVPSGVPTKSDFAISETKLLKISEGEVLIRTILLSVDPYMRERMTPSKSYLEDFKLGEVITGAIIGQIQNSKNQNYNVGDIVSAFTAWQEFNVSDGSNLRKIEKTGSALENSLSLLGSPGLTAYFGLLEHGRPKENETIVISAAAGSVGSTVGQIAKIYGCRVIAITGSDEKNQLLVEQLGFDAVLNYKTEENLETSLRKVCPNGIDIYFDNVGNDWLNFISSLLNKNSRVVLCGQVAQYNGDKYSIDSAILGKITKKSAVIKGFMITDYNQEQSAHARSQIVKWLEEDKIKSMESVLYGIESAPQAFLNLFNGQNVGKQLVKVSELV